MLSIKSLGLADSGIAEYYESLSQDDYYQKGSEPAGHWQGSLADGLLLFGDVKNGQLSAMFRGEHPLTGEALASNCGDRHKAGWDLTFSSPKSVSVVWGLADLTQRQLIEQAHDAAVVAAISYLEKRAFTGRDRQNKNPITGILAASFQHGSSRELDPQLHSHVLVANLGDRGDGTFSAIDFDSRYKMAAGAVYRAELAARFVELGYEVERDGKSFKLKQVDQSICDHFSKRRDQITASLKETGLTSQKAASIAALSTRQTKVTVPRDRLHELWRIEAVELGLGLPAIKPNNSNENFLAPLPLNINTIISSLTKQASTFTVMQLEAAIATEMQGLCSPNQFEIFLKSTIKICLEERGKLGLVALRDKNISQRRTCVRYTTREILEIEKGIIEKAACRQHETAHETQCAKILANYSSLSAEQLIALAHITEKPGSVQLVQGLAGTGKSYLLRAAKAAWENNNLNVIGTSLSGKAAESLEQGSGISSQTLHSLLSELDSGQRSLSTTDVVVLDEAGMVGSRQMDRLLNHVHTAKAKAILVGDAMQLQPIDAGGIFKNLAEELGFASLQDIRRQEKSADKKMIHDIIHGDAKIAIAGLAERNQLSVKPYGEIHSDLVNAWEKLRDPANPKETLMLAGTRADVRKLNTLAREKLKAQHRQHSEIAVTTEAGERQFSVGDRVVFTRNSRLFDVKNGQTGTLQGWQINLQGKIEFSVHTDAGKNTTFSLEKYAHIDHGYALSVHKAQGQTVDYSLVLVSESMADRQWSYVAASRHRKELRVFVAAEHAENLPFQLSRSRQKDVSIDYYVPQVIHEIEL